MSTMYICQNCRELYKPPRRKDGICKTCNDAVSEAAAKVDAQLAIDIAAAKERADLKRQNARTIALLKRYKPQ